MKNKFLILFLALFLNVNIAQAQHKKKNSHSTLHTIVFYLPNRVLDVFDIFRARLRVGPGISAGVRATKVAQIFLGTHATVYAGLPGPRLRPLPKLPVGLESHNGAALSVLDATVNGGIGPGYSSTEFGAGLQAAIIGADLGFDPVELADLITGIFTIDLRDDDL